MNQNNEKSSDLTLTHLVYFLQALAFFSGITAIVGVIINYVKLDDVRGRWLESHFRWQIQTFWYALLLVIVGVLLLFIVVGWFFLAFAFFWVLYRIIKGWIRLSEGQWMLL